MNDELNTAWMETLAGWLDASAPSHARALRATATLIQKQDSAITTLAAAYAEAQSSLQTAMTEVSDLKDALEQAGDTFDKGYHD